MISPIKNRRKLHQAFERSFIWDRLFGTCQKEEESPTYGINKKIQEKVNPLYLNFHEFKDIYKDLKSPGPLRKKLYYIFDNPTKIQKEKTTEWCLVLTIGNKTYF